MNREVLVSISGLQLADGTNETVEVISRGEYHFRGGTHFVTYEETTEEASNRMDTKCILKITKEQIELIKKGEVTTRLLFEKGLPHISHYTTQFGDIVIGTTTNSIKLVEEEHELLAELAYSLDINDCFVAENQLTVKVSDCTESI